MNRKRFGVGAKPGLFKVTEPAEKLGIDWAAEYARSRVRVSQEELARHLGATPAEWAERHRPTLEVDYIAESGTKISWPKALAVDPCGRGPLRALLRAFYGREPPLPRMKDSERAVFGWTSRQAILSGRPRTIDVEHIGAIDLAEFPIAAPAGRLIGRATIARWLGLKDPDQVTQYSRDYPWIVKKIGALFVADTAALITDLDELWRQTTAAARSAAGHNSVIRRRQRHTR